MQVVLGTNIPFILNLLKGDNTYEEQATVTYQVLSNDGSTVVVSSKSCIYTLGVKGYLDNLDVSSDWVDQSEGNYLLKWSVSGSQISGFPSVYIENLVVVPGGEVEFGYTLTESLRIILAVLAGKASGGNTENITYRDINDVKDRVNAVVTRRGDRTDVVTDGS